MEKIKIKKSDNRNLFACHILVIITRSIIPTPTANPPCRLAQIINIEGNTKRHLCQSLSSKVIFKMTATKSQLIICGLIPAKEISKLADKISGMIAHLPFRVTSIKDKTANDAYIKDSPIVLVKG